MHMNIAVLLFFLHTTIATTIVGGVFVKREGALAKYFGLGLLLETVAFAAWGLAIVMPDMLATMVTVGAVLTLVSFLFFMRAGIDHMAPSQRMTALFIGTLFVVGTFVAGRYVFPTPKFISDEGFLFFNLAPFVQLMYVTMLLVVSMPLVAKVASLFKEGYDTLVTYTLIIQVVGAVTLITSTDPQSLLAAGWAIGIAYLLLWVTLLFGKDIWRIY